MLSKNEKIEVQGVTKELIGEEISEHAAKIGSLNTMRRVIGRLRKNKQGAVSEKVKGSTKSELETLSCDIQEVVDMELEKIGSNNGYLVVKVGKHTNLYRSKKDQLVCTMEELVVRVVVIVGIVSAIMWLVCK